MDDRVITALRKINTTKPQYHKITDVTKSAASWSLFMCEASSYRLESMDYSSLSILKFAKSGAEGFAIVRDHIYDTVHLYKLGG